MLRIRAAGYVDWQEARKYVYEGTAAVVPTPALPSRSHAALVVQDACPEEPQALVVQDACPEEPQPSPSLVSLCSVSQPFFTGIEYVVVSCGRNMVCDWHDTLTFDDSRAFQLYMEFTTGTHVL